MEQIQEHEKSKTPVKSIGKNPKRSLCGGKLHVHTLFRDFLLFNALSDFLPLTKQLLAGPR